MNSSLPIVPFLNSFFNIYHAYVIEVGALNGRVQGKIMYIDEETQEFVWYYSSFNEIPRAIQLLIYLKNDTKPRKTHSIPLNNKRYNGELNDVSKTALCGFCGL